MPELITAIPIPIQAPIMNDARRTAKKEKKANL